MRTRRSPDSSISEMLRIRSSSRPCSLRASIEDLRVDRIDDLHVARQQALEQRHRPAFQRLGKKRVVGVGEGSARDVPGHVEIGAVYIGEQAHQLGDRDGGVRVVELDGDGIRQRREVGILLQMAAQDVLQRGRTEEEFLAKAQFLPRGRGVRRIEYPGQAFRLVALAQRTDMVTIVEGIKQDRINRLCRPEPERVDTLCAPTDDGSIVRRRNHPDRPQVRPQRVDAKADDDPRRA